MNGSVASAIAEWSVAYARAVAAQRWADGLLAAMVVRELLDECGDAGLRGWAHRADHCFEQLPEAERIGTLRQLREEAHRVVDEVVGEPIADPVLDTVDPNWSE